MDIDLLDIDLKTLRHLSFRIIVELLSFEKLMVNYFCSKNVFLRNAQFSVKHETQQF